MYSLRERVIFLTFVLLIVIPRSLAAQNETGTSGISVTNPENLVAREDVRFRDTTRVFSRVKFEGLRKRYASIEGIVMIGLVNDKGEVLLKGREQWAPPGGAVEPGEDWAAAARRIMMEQTGAAVTIVNPVLVEKMTFKPKEVGGAQFTAYILHFRAYPAEGGAGDLLDIPDKRGSSAMFHWFDKVPEDAHPNHINHIKLYLN